MSFSQDYYPLIEENRTWNVISVALVGPTSWDTTYSTLTYEFSGDTIIDSHTYLKLNKSNEEFPSNWNLCWYMREDNEKKIWGRTKSDNDEMLMYDFSVESGDSVLVGFDPVYLFVDSITELVLSQTVRKKYWLSCKSMPEYSETWIEGIGSSKGICWSGSAMVVGGWYYALCMSENGDIIYKNPNYESCYLITGISEIDRQIIQIYPNPAKDLLRIENNNNIEINSISLTNINGQIIKKFDPNNTQLDISEISSGLYLLKLSYKNGEFTKKIIIE